MTNSLPGDPSDFLMQQFDAITEFEDAVYLSSRSFGPTAVKTWYYRKQVECFGGRDDLLQLCKELEQVVPLDHPYWSDPAIGRL